MSDEAQPYRDVERHAFGQDVNEECARTTLQEQMLFSASGSRKQSHWKMPTSLLSPLSLNLITTNGKSIK